MGVQSDSTELSSETFEALADITLRESGLQLLPEKQLMVQSRLKPRLRALQIPDFHSYVLHLQSDMGAPELRQMISALTTNVTHFFRESHHFELLTERMISVFKRKLDRGERIRIWSAGCSKGQEPYSIAMHLLHALPELLEADFKILATDIDPKVIAFARLGQYSAKEFETAPKKLVDTFFLPSDNHDYLVASAQIKRYITFKELNLIQTWPMNGRFDTIFCRNVVIYFNSETQNKLWPRFTQALAADGLLFLGHSERIVDPTAYGLKSAGTTSYQHDTSCLTNNIKT